MLSFETYISIKDKLPGPADSNAHGNVIAVIDGKERTVHWETVRENAGAVTMWKSMRLKEVTGAS